eukprot:Gb_10714 [translate_table: standard]
MAGWWATAQDWTWVYHQDCAYSNM